MNELSPIAYLLDVDNTLIDSDRIVDDLRQHVATAFDETSQKRYWDIFDKLHEELGYADYLGALQHCRCENPCDQNFLKISLFILDYPFSDRLFPKALDLIDYLSTRGTVAIVTNGDVVFQPRKIEQSGLLEAVGERLLVDIHKERDWDDIEKRYAAQHYVVIDDEPKVLTAAKRKWKDRVTTIFVRQGRHAHDPQHVQPYPQPDATVDSIGELLESDYRRLLERI